MYHSQELYTLEGGEQVCELDAHINCKPSPALDLVKVYAEDAVTWANDFR